MLSHGFAGHLARRNPAAAPYPYDGAEQGLCAEGQARTALTIQQQVPNIGPTETSPRTSVNPTHEQGWGRAPGWQWGWMRKNIPLNLAFGSGSCARLGQTRVEYALNSGAHKPGSGKWQGMMHPTPRRGVLDQPQTAYLTAAVAPIPTWGEQV
jgi:hypothetical protein